jgi:hypothetical protein
MRIYPLSGDVLAIDAPEGHFEAAEDGGFDLPDTLSDRLHSMGVRGRRQWEDAIDRQRRTAAEESSHRGDPSTLLAAVEELIRTVAGKSATSGAPDPDAARDALIALGWTPPAAGDAPPADEAPSPKATAKAQAKAAA